MKKLSFLIIALFICISVRGCSQPAPEPVKTQLPDIPRSLYAVTEITPESMAELEKQVSRLDIYDFLHPDRIAIFEQQGISLAIDNIRLQDCNTITFDIVLTKTDGTIMTMPATGMLMYQYLPMNESLIAGLQVLWGNISICDNLILMTNIDKLSFWRSDTSFTQSTEYFFILDSVKNKDGYLLPYFSSKSSGFMNITNSGRLIDIPLLLPGDDNSIFGTHKLMESRNFNTTARAATRLNCFYGDETEKQIFISFDRDDDYYGTDYAMYDFESGQFFTSTVLATYSTQNCRYDLYGMCISNGRYYVGKENTFLAVKRVNGKIADIVMFKSDINPREFGTDTKTGWNTHTHVSLSEDENTLSIGCDKTNKVINIDFLQGGAQTLNTATMPPVQGVDNSPNSMHMLYCTKTENGKALMVRIMSGHCRMDHIAEVTGRWGVDWLAGFYTHDYIYVLTQDHFTLFRWEGTNYWKKAVSITGDFEISDETVNRLCSNYGV